MQVFSFFLLRAAFANWQKNTDHDKKKEHNVLFTHHYSKLLNLCWHIIRHCFSGKSTCLLFHEKYETFRRQGTLPYEILKPVIILKHLLICNLLFHRNKLSQVSSHHAVAHYCPPAPGPALPVVPTAASLASSKDTSPETGAALLTAFSIHGAKVNWRGANCGQSC